MFSVINDLFFCFKLPSAILNKDLSIVHKYNFDDKLLDILYNSTLINDLKEKDFEPCTLSFNYDNINFSCVKFFHYNENPDYFLIGPYILKDKKYKNDTNYKDIKKIDKDSIDNMLKFYNQMLNSFSSINKKSYSPLVNGAIKYIEKNYSNPITIDEICCTFNVNKCYFCSIFKKETGTTFINYLNNYKIDKSKELLKDLSLSLLDISLAVGFNNQSYYSTTFKKFTNQTPLEYRAYILNNS